MREVDVWWWLSSPESTEERGVVAVDWERRLERALAELKAHKASERLQGDVEGSGAHPLLEGDQDEVGDI